MTRKKRKIAVVAPGSRLTADVAASVRTITAKLYSGGGAEIHFHPQCFESHGHFAGDDAARTQAFLEVANDESYDAVWCARGGYGSCRVAEAVIRGLTDVARRKAYVGYSDAGTLLAQPGVGHRRNADQGHLADGEQEQVETAGVGRA